MIFLLSLKIGIKKLKYLYGDSKYTLKNSTNNIPKGMQY